MADAADPGKRMALLLDGHSLAYRAFYALPVENFSTSTGQPTNAVYGFTSMFLNALRNENPSHVAVAFDVSRQTFRTEQYPEYKGTRAASPEGFHGQVELIKDVLDAMGIATFAVDGFEADDVIATLTKACERDGIPVNILTGDRDTFQLINGQTTVLYPTRGVSELARMTPDAISEKYGVTPEQYVDFAALRGDSSDNLPGIPGVGEKTAAKWITQYGDVNGVIAHADAISGKVGESLRSALPQLVLNRSLMQLVDDVPLNVTVDDFQRQPVSPEAVHELFDALQFRALRDRLDVVVDSTKVDVVTSIQSEVVSIDAFLDSRSPEAPVAVWFAGTWGSGQGELTGIAATTRDDSGRVITASATFIDASLRRMLADESVVKLMHDCKGPLLAGLNTDVRISNVAWDTALAAYILQPGQRSYRLEDIVPGHTVASQPSDQLTFDTDQADTAQLESNSRAVWTLTETQREQLNANGGTELLQSIEIPVSRCLAEMEFVGIAIDQRVLGELSEEFSSSVLQAATDAHAAAGEEFNLGSPKQLQHILFDKLALPKTKKIKTGFTTDADALTWLLQVSDGNPVVEAVLRWRDANKLKQTVDGLIPLAARDGRIHTTFTQTVTATGRLSSLDPNLQNIPVRTVSGRRIRSAFVASKGYAGLMTADYSQIEMRIMAHLSQDAGLIEAFAQGEDLHTSVAALVFDLDRAEVDSDIRNQIKAVSYGLAYGLSAYGLGQSLSITQGEANELMERYFARFGGVRDYLESVVRQARSLGYTETMFGRRRYLPDLSSDNRQRREMAERMALNAPIQGTAADIMKIAMLRVRDALQSANLSSRILLQVHDELVIDVAAGEEQAVRDVVVEEMMGAANLNVALDVGVGFGPSWFDAAH